MFRLLYYRCLLPPTLFLWHRFIFQGRGGKLMDLSDLVNGGKHTHSISSSSCVCLLYQLLLLGKQSKLEKYNSVGVKTGGGCKVGGGLRKRRCKYHVTQSRFTGIDSFLFVSYLSFRIFFLATPTRVKNDGAKWFISLTEDESWESRRWQHF